MENAIIDGVQYNHALLFRRLIDGVKRISLIANAFSKIIPPAIFRQTIKSMGSDPDINEISEFRAVVDALVRELETRKENANRDTIFKSVAMVMGGAWLDVFVNGGHSLLQKITNDLTIDAHVDFILFANLQANLYIPQILSYALDVRLVIGDTTYAFGKTNTPSIKLAEHRDANNTPLFKFVKPDAKPAASVLQRPQDDRANLARLKKEKLELAEDFEAYAKKKQLENPKGYSIDVNYKANLAKYNRLMAEILEQIAAIEKRRRLALATAPR